LVQSAWHVAELEVCVSRKRSRYALEDAFLHLKRSGRDVLGHLHIRETDFGAERGFAVGAVAAPNLAAAAAAAGEGEGQLALHGHGWNGNVGAAVGGGAVGVGGGGIAAAQHAAAGGGHVDGEVRQQQQQLEMQSRSCKWQQRKLRQMMSRMKTNTKIGKTATTVMMMISFTPGTGSC
jgi:hypothetical protein